MVLMLAAIPLNVEILPDISCELFNLGNISICILRSVAHNGRLLPRAIRTVLGRARLSPIQPVSSYFPTFDGVVSHEL